MYQIQTILLALPVCGFLLLLSKFYIARQAVWKLQKANLVSDIPCTIFFFLFQISKRETQERRIG